MSRSRGKREKDRVGNEEFVILESPPPPERNLGIQCPICRRSFKTAEQVDLHIDTCTDPLSSSSSQSYNLRPPKPVISTPSSPSSSSTSNHFPAIKPLPKLNYSMYNETKSRAMLAEHGLSTTGNKSLLAARHRVFVNLHNVNIDRRYPQSRREILKQLENWDVTLSRQEKRKELDSVE